LVNSGEIEGEMGMTNVKDLTIDELECLIEQKILEVLGDPDSGLELKEEFKQELKSRLENPSRRIPHDEVVDRIGQER
jgi:hypothetical protein